MTTLREAVAQTLDALTKIHPGNMSWETGDAWLNAVQILREALAQPDPGLLTDEDVVDAVDPVEYHGWVLREVLFDQGEPVGHRAPPQRKPQPEQEPVADTESDVLTATYMLGVHAGKKATNRKPLTDEEITALVLEWWCPTMVTAKDRKFVRAIERAHGIGEKK